LDDLTAEFYASNAKDYAIGHDSAHVERLHQLLHVLGIDSPRVLEIGGGSGRDAAFLLRLGHATTYTDGCKEMLAQALTLHPELAPRARLAAFPLSEDDDLLRERFDLVLCAAVIMHMDNPSLQQLARQVAQLLVNGGHLVLSHSRGHQCVDVNRDSQGRLFLERTPAVVDRIFEAQGFCRVQLIESSDGLGRHGIAWATHVLQKTS
jgi:SAM-dependent methyltransferase